MSESSSNNVSTIVIETPETIEYVSDKIKSITDFFNSLNMERIRIGWEIRQRQKQLPKELINLLQEQNIIHIVDLSREEPSYNSDQIYTRLFGKGEYTNLQTMNFSKYTTRLRIESITRSH